MYALMQNTTTIGRGGHQFLETTAERRNFYANDRY